MAFETGIRFFVDSRQATRHTERFQRALRGVGGAARKAFGGLRSVFGRVTRGIFNLRAAVVGLAGAAGLGLLGNAIGSFERQMDTVAAVAGVTGDTFDRLSEKARDLGSRTEFSAKQAGQGMEFLARAGFGVDEMLQSIGPSLDLAISGQLDLSRSADIASNVLQAFQLPGREMSRVVDVLSAGAASANTNVEQLGEAIKLVGPVAAAAGISLEETVAAIGSLSNAGIQATSAGTGLRQTLAKLLVPTGNAKDIMQEFGLTMEDIDVVSNGLINSIETMAQAGVTGGDAMQFFGLRAGPAFQVLRDSIEPTRNLTENMERAEGTARRISEQVADNLIGDFRRLKSTFSELVLVVGEEGLNEALRDFVQEISTFLQTDTARKMAAAVGETLAGAFDILSGSLEKVFDLTKDLMNNFGQLLPVFLQLINHFDRLNKVLVGTVALQTNISDAFGIGDLDERTRELRRRMIAEEGAAIDRRIEERNKQIERLQSGESIVDVFGLRNTGSISSIFGADRTTGLEGEPIEELRRKFSQRMRIAMGSETFGPDDPRRIRASPMGAGMLSEGTVFEGLTPRELSSMAPPADAISNLETHTRALEESNEALLRQSRDIGDGVIRFWRDYKDIATDAAFQVERVLGSSLRSFEDTMAALATRTESLSEAFQRLGDVIVAELARIATQLALTGVIEGLASIFSGGSTTAASVGARAGLRAGETFASFAHGGVATQPTIARVAENTPEAIIPLEGGAVPVRFEGGGRGHVTNNVTFNVSTIDAKSFDDQFMETFGRKIQEVTNGVASTAERSPRMMRRFRA